MGFDLTALLVIGTDFTGSWKSNHHTIATTTAHIFVSRCIYNVHGNVIRIHSKYHMTETGGSEKAPDLLQVTCKLYHIMLYTSSWSRFELTTLVVICTDCIGSCISKYHAITATTAPIFVSRCIYNVHGNVIRNQNITWWRGPKNIHFQVLKHHPELKLQTLSDLMNDISEIGDFPSILKSAIVISITTPRKDPSERWNYRLIYSTN